MVAFWKKKLAFQFSVMILGLVSIVVLAVSFYLLFHEKKVLEQELQNRGLAIANSLARQAGESILREDDYALFKLIQMVTRNRGQDLTEEGIIPYAMVLDNQGRALFHTDSGFSRKVHKDDLTDQLIKAEVPQVNSLRWGEGSENVYDISVPVRMRNIKIGTVRLGISKAGMEKEMAEMAIKVLTVLFILMLAGTWAIWRFSKKLTQPIGNLSESAQKVKAGDLDQRVEVSRQDEIGVLAESFNQMCAALKRSRDEIERTQRHLFQTEKMASLGKLAAGVAHEINNPLGGILNCLHNLSQDEMTPEKQAEYMALMREGLKRIQNTVRNLLHFAQQHRPSLTTTDINNLVEKALSLMQYYLNRKEIHVERELDEGAPLLIVDEHQIEQVLVNLILNAVQAMEEGGTLTIKTRWVHGSKSKVQSPKSPVHGEIQIRPSLPYALSPDADSVEITVTDTGCGIPPEVFPYIFDPFFTTKGVGEGTGLGLSLSQAIIEQHQGSLTVESQVGKGSTFTVRLPVATQAKTLETSSSATLS